MEIGANNHELERDELGQLLDGEDDSEGGFLLSFEPLLDKYSYLLSFSSGGGAENNAAVNLGLQHRRGLALPYAVGHCGESKSDRSSKGIGAAVFHVTALDGCSSLRPPTADFKLQNQEIASTGAGMSWPSWVVDRCAHLQEERSVPCVSLATVVGNWLGARPIARMKVDAQGSDLDVIKSAGEFLHRLLFINLEVHSRLAAPLYHGQASCDEVLLTMRNLGFVLADARKIGSACNFTMPEGNLDFVRREVWPLWRSFYKDYAYCDVFSAAGACGGPHCIAPRIRAQVNRTGGCEGEIQDRSTFESSALGMVQVWVSPGCEENLQIRLVDQHISFWIHQGPVKGKVCSVQSGFIASTNGPMVRLQVDDRRAMGAHKSKLVILKGLLDQETEKAGESLTMYLDASARFDPDIYWPQPCELLMKSAHWIHIFRVSTQFVATNKSSEFCVLDKF